MATKWTYEKQGSNVTVRAHGRMAQVITVHASGYVDSIGLKKLPPRVRAHAVKLAKAGQFLILGAPIQGHIQCAI